MAELKNLDMLSVSVVDAAVTSRTTAITEAKEELKELIKENTDAIASLKTESGDTYQTKDNAADDKTALETKIDDTKSELDQRIGEEADKAAQALQEKYDELDTRIGEEVNTINDKIDEVKENYATNEALDTHKTEVDDKLTEISQGVGQVRAGLLKKVEDEEATRKAADDALQTAIDDRYTKAEVDEAINSAIAGVLEEIAKRF